MVTIKLNTWVNAPVERCFRLASSVEFHLASDRSIKEIAASGVTSGLLREGDTVKWSARHFMVRLTHTSWVEVSRPFSHLREVMTAGIFARYEHEHYFAAMDDGTRVRDELKFSARFGPLGRLMEALLMRRYMTKLLKRRNAALKRAAESNEWRMYLEGQPEIVALTGDSQ
ncbi:MAG TPA: SRPBCC family protein [Edaphobacter sp.]|jgi:ligand-binding SRPBCC domain-containing protein|nr:SRPBCC family protein [Edaphobacter sp.]